MSLLRPEEYDISYFDHEKTRKVGLLEHPAGYSYYERWFRFEGEGSLREYWKAVQIIVQYKDLVL